MQNIQLNFGFENTTIEELILGESLNSSIEFILEIDELGNNSIPLLYSFDWDVKGEIGFGIDINGPSFGSIDLTYPILTSLNIPSFVEPGNNFTINTGGNYFSQSPRLTGESLSIGNLELVLIMGLEGEITNISSPLVFDDTLQQINSLDLSTTIDTRIPLLELTASEFEPDINIGDIASFQISLPNGKTNTETGSSQSQSGTLESIGVEITEPLLNFRFELLELLGLVEPVIIGNLKTTFDTPFFEAGYTILSANVQQGFGLVQTIEFDPDDVEVILTIGEVQQTGTLGDSFDFIMPNNTSEPIVGEISYNLTGNIDVDYYFAPIVSIGLEALEGYMKFGPVDVGFGPLWESSISDTRDKIPLFNMTIPVTSEYLGTVNQTFTISTEPQFNIWSPLAISGQNGVAEIFALNNDGNLVDFGNIGLYSYSGNTLQLDKETVVLIHGWRGSEVNTLFQDPSEASITQLADELSSYYQVLFLDWSQAAIDPNSLIPYKAAGRINPIAEWVAEQLEGINEKITLIGHSLGGLKSAAIGNILNPTKDIDIISLDAAYPAQNGVLGFNPYDLDLTDENDRDDIVRDLRLVSDNSIAFVISDNNLVDGGAGDNDYAGTANSSFLVEFEPSIGTDAHGEIQFVFEQLLQKIDVPNKLDVLQGWTSSFAKDKYDNKGEEEEELKHEGVIQVDGENRNIETISYYLRNSTLQSINWDTFDSNSFAQLDPILRPFEDPNDFGEQIMERNDDGSSTILDLPFPINFYGNVYNQFYINNNGNITFESPLVEYTPQQFPVSNQPMIAPYWADVDTRNQQSRLVYYAVPNEDTVLITWDNVGYFDSHADLTNTFQLVLRDRSDDTGNEGDFDIEFRYGKLEWTTGDASGGSGGLGGTPAQAGFDAGNSNDFFILNRSFTENIVLVEHESNVSRNTPGLWSFAIRAGVTPGETPTNPLLPVITNEGFNFEYFVQNPVEFVFIDPDIAIGYDYIVNAGPNIAAVQIPMEVAGDDGVYDIWLPDENGILIDSDFAIQPNEIFDFTQNGFPDGTVTFGIRGIDEGVRLDPADGNAFVTGLQFVAQGLVDISQNPVTIFVNDPPTDIQLNNFSIEENLPINTIIGNFTSVDPDGDLEFTYTLVIGEGDIDNGIFTIEDDSLLSTESFDFETKNSYSIRVQTDDGNGGTFEKAFTITVVDVNEPPTAVNFTSVTELAENTTINDGIKVADIAIVDDALGDNLLSLTGADADGFEIRGNELFYIGESPDFESKNQYQVTVNVQDLSLGDDVFASNDFSLTILDVNEPPTAVNLISVISELEENTAIEEGIKVADIAIVDDALGDNLLSLTGADVDGFEIRGNELFYIGESPDFESKNQYQVTVNVQDLSLGDDVFASNDFSLTILDVNEPPTAVNFTSVITELAENTAIEEGIKVADIAIVDDALGNNLLSLTGADVDGFEIRGNELFYIGESPDFESKNQYQVTVNVQDLSLGDDVFASNDFTLTILDVNEAPTAVNLASVISELEENTAIDDGIKVADIAIVDDALGDNLLSLTGGDADGFEIRGNELFYTGESPDFESKNQYQVTVNVQDLSLGEDVFASNDFTLTILDVNEAPIENLEIADRTLQEGEALNFSIAEDTFIDPDGDTLFYSAFLEDGTTLLPSWLNFDIDTLTFSGIPSNSDVGILRIGVFANDGFLTTSQVFTIEIEPIPNNPPTITSANTFNIPENTNIVGNIIATDPNEGDVLTYSISGGADATFFEINPETGALSFKEAPDFENPLDQGNDNIYDLEVTVTDQGALTAQQSIAITVTDVNEAPTAVNLSNTITELAENSEVGTGIKVADITIIDDALGTNELFLTGADADSFAIMGTELFYIDASPDFETKNQYQVTVNVDDKTVGATPDATVNFTLAITDVSDSIDTLLNDNLYRFQTGDGTYMFMGEDEKQMIEGSYPNFVLEGLAFNISLKSNDNLIAFNRFRNSDKSGAYLYAGEAESINVREMYPQFIEEGIAFYALDGDAQQGTDIYRLNNNGSYIYVAEAEKDQILANFSDQFVLEGVAFEAVTI